MPKLAGVNLVGVFLAALAIFFIGFIWYGLLFTAPWMEANGLFLMGEGSDAPMQWLTADGLQTATGAPDPMIMAGGFLLSLVLSFGLGWHMNQKSISKLSTAALFGLWIALLIGVPVAAYDFIYTPWHSVPGLLVDASHIVVGFVAACSIMSFFD